KKGARFPPPLRMKARSDGLHFAGIEFPLVAFGILDVDYIIIHAGDDAFDSLSVLVLELDPLAGLELGLRLPALLAALLGFLLFLVLVLVLVLVLFLLFFVLFLLFSLVLFLLFFLFFLVLFLVFFLVLFTIEGA